MIASRTLFVLEPRTQTVLRADDVIMVWKTNPPSKRGRWVGPGVCIGTHRGSVWVNMRGSLWKCSQLQCKLATTEESRGLEIQNQLLDDMKAEFKSSQDVEFTLMWSVKEFLHQMLTSNQCAPRYPRRGRQELSTGTDVFTSDITSSVSS